MYVHKVTVVIDLVFNLRVKEQNTLQTLIKEYYTL